MTADGRLRPEFVKRGIKLDRSVDPEIIYMHFNTQEKIGGVPNPLGGFSKEKIALRRAIAMAYRIDDQLRIIRKGQAVKAEYPIPPGVAGHDPNYKSSIRYDPRDRQCAARHASVIKRARTAIATSRTASRS